MKSSKRVRSPKSSRSKRTNRKTPKSKGKLKLEKIVKSPIKTKKLRAYFSDGTHTDFGFRGMSDMTKHKDPFRKKNYISRHSKRENWKSPKSAGALSRWVLWNKPSLKGSIADYKKRFKL